MWPIFTVITTFKVILFHLILFVHVCDVSALCLASCFHPPFGATSWTELFPPLNWTKRYSDFLTSLGGSLAVRRSAVAEPSDQSSGSRGGGGGGFIGETETHIHPQTRFRVDKGRHARFPVSSHLLNAACHKTARSRSETGLKLLINALRRMVALQPGGDPSVRLREAETDA